ncbi:MAG: FixH family protein [Geminicoccaceae bacterium]
MAAAFEPDTSPSQPMERAVPGGWIPWVFVGLFLLVLAANGTLVVIAVSTFTGLETTSAYEKGLAYNDRLAAVAEQESLGWKAELDVTPTGERRVGLALELVDRLDNPITSAEVEATLLRPVQEGHDMILRFDDRDDGRYGAEIDLPFPGQWDVQLIARAHGKTYRLAERIHVTP